MTRRSLPALVFASTVITTLAACAPSAMQLAPAVAIPPRATPAAAPRTDLGSAALVWTTDDDGKATTVWLEPSAEAGYREVGRASEILVATGADVWRWHVRTQTAPTVACPDNQAPAGEGVVTEASVERLGSTEHHTVVEPASSAGNNEINQSSVMVGSIGPYVFIRKNVFAYGCGAHGATDVSLAIWNLAARKATTLLETDEEAALNAAERADAREKLPAFDGTLKLEDVDYRGPLPIYGAHGWLHVEHAFTTFACYACSDGAWSSYTQSINIEARHLPKHARAYAHAPAAVSAWMDAHPAIKLGGWSEVGADAARSLAAVMPNEEHEG